MSKLGGKSILVTGGTGSFGQQFTRTALATLNPARLIVYSRDELKQFEMAQSFSDERLQFVLGDVRDKGRLREVMSGVDIVVHAAALKQVPAAEQNPSEPVKTNIQGAINLIECAIERGVQRVIALSTDKAASPVNLYGATKMVSDKLFVAANAERETHGTRFSLVRYGNVVGSRGSVIPVFLRQRKSGVLSITDRRMTRFWITLEQGVQFVIRSLTLMTGGEIFVPKLPTAAIVDVAQAVAPSCKVEIVGVRPGEKLHEVLIPPEQAHHTLEFDDFYIIKPRIPKWDDTPWKDGRPLADGYRYASDSNHWKLSVDDIRALLEGLGNELVDPLRAAYRR